MAMHQTRHSNHLSSESATCTAITGQFFHLSSKSATFSMPPTRALHQPNALRSQGTALTAFPSLQRSRRRQTGHYITHNTTLTGQFAQRHVQETTQPGHSAHLSSESATFSMPVLGRCGIPSPRSFALSGKALALSRAVNASTAPACARSSSEPCPLPSLRSWHHRDTLSLKYHSAAPSALQPRLRQKNMHRQAPARQIALSTGMAPCALPV